ncbi:hypothetical protein CLOM_g22479 [Closterium sp. NIES-68]|nr:hypothetical protein CLOM_g22479 [Closterium sp. NIES-68]GJP77516.1 hypothetical protein CLOP_g7896 [Closterium sp. NIES-67]
MKEGGAGGWGDCESKALGTISTGLRETRGANREEGDRDDREPVWKERRRGSAFKWTEKGGGREGVSGGQSGMDIGVREQDVSEGGKVDLACDPDILS